MVRAILEGRKTQTRRVITLQNTSIDGRGHRMPYKGALWSDFDFGRAWADMGPSPAGNSGPYLHVPLAGQDETVHRLYSDFFPGDRLWVRETWRPEYEEDTGLHLVRYAAGGHEECFDDDIPKWLDTARGNDNWRPSIHMPRWASRILLEVTDVRVEPVRDIGAEDAMAEGSVAFYVNYADGRQELDEGGTIDAFRDLWDTINAKRGYGWDANPWVWVVNFKRLEP